MRITLYYRSKEPVNHLSSQQMKQEQRDRKFRNKSTTREHIEMTHNCSRHQTTLLTIQDRAG